MKRMLLIAAGLFFVLCTPLVFGVAIQGSKHYVQKFHHPKIEYQLAQRAKAVAEANRIAALKPALPTTGTPQAVFPEVDHDFGMMEPGVIGRHVFVVKNEGDGYLRLTAGDSSCKCTGLAVGGEPIPPGGESEVVMEWNSDVTRPSFRQYAYVKTNDPNQKRVKLEIHGKVRITLGQEPSEVWFSRLSRGKSSEQPMIVYSQEWEDFQLGDFVSSWEGLTWKVQPADPGELRRLSAKSGYEIRFTTPTEFSDKEFREWFRYQAIPSDSQAAPVEKEIMLHGRVLRSLSVYGTTLLEGGVIDLGTLDQGEASTVHLYLRSRSFDGELKILEVESTPEFLQVEIKPFSGEAADRTFHLDVTVPKDAPPCRYSREEGWGTVRVRTNHPLEPEVELKVELHIRKPVFFN